MSYSPVNATRIGWPGGKPNEYIVLGGRVQNVTGQAEGRLICTPYWSPRALSISRIAINVESAGSAGSVVRIGAYADDDGVPGALLFDAGTVDSTGTGTKEIVTSQTLPAGRFWLAAAVQGAATTLATLAGTSVTGAWNQNAMLSPGGGGLDSVYFTFMRASVSGALPDPALASRAGAHNAGYAFRVRLA